MGKKNPVGVGLGPVAPPPPLSYIGSSKFDEQLSHVTWQLRSLEAELKATLLAQELIDPKPRLRANRDAAETVPIKPHVPVWTASDAQGSAVEDVSNLPDVSLPALHIHHHYHKHVHHYRGKPPDLELLPPENSVSGLETKLPVLAHVHHHTHELPPPRTSYAPSEELLALIADERAQKTKSHMSEEFEEGDDNSSVSGASVTKALPSQRNKSQMLKVQPAGADDRKGSALQSGTTKKMSQLRASTMKTFGKRWSVGAEAMKQRATATGQQLGLFEVKDLEPASGWQVPPFLEWCEVDMMPVTPPEEGLRRDLAVLFHASHTPNLGVRDYLKKRQVEKRLYRYWGQSIPRTPPELQAPTPRKPRSPKPASPTHRRPVRNLKSASKGSLAPAAPPAPPGRPGPASAARPAGKPVDGRQLGRGTTQEQPGRPAAQVQKALRTSFHESQKQTRFAAPGAESAPGSQKSSPRKPSPAKPDTKRPQQTAKR